MAYSFYNPYSQQSAGAQPVVNQQSQNYAGFQQPQTIWVQGEAGAKAYPVAPGNQMILMDSETNRFYIKSADQIGMPQPLRVFEYSELTQKTSANSENQNDFISRDEFKEVQSQIAEIKKTIDDFIS